MKITFDRRHFLKLAGTVGAMATLGMASALEAKGQSLGLGIAAGSDQEAARFLTQATLGPNLDLIREVSAFGPQSWLQTQFNLPIGQLEPLVEEFAEALDEEDEAFYSIFSWSWWQRVMVSPDVLRQRIALALSEIFVISRVPDELQGNPWGVANYYDMLLKNAFGNFRDLLFDVTTHPAMGFYLSHVRNRKSNLQENRFPDENYAREVMQLFSIGLFDLNQDGTHKNNLNGEPIPTYTNAEITELAKVFTGLIYVGGDENLDEFLYAEPEFTEPMVMYEPEHEPGQKRLLNGFVIPAGQTGMQDVNNAIDHLFNHPNVGPFIGYRLIQRLVKSNPTPDYIERVTKAFNDNGHGVRGDMRAVIQAVLLDPEARDASWLNDPNHGMLREPIIRYVHLCRALKATSEDGFYRNGGYTANWALKQYPMQSPSVFNFFLPTHQPLGPISNAGLVAPEFQITTSVSAITGVNFMEMITLGEYVMELPEDEDDMSVYLDIDIEEELADDMDALLDHLDLLLTHGTLSQPLRVILKRAMEPMDEPKYRVLIALYLITISPEYAVLR